MDTREFGEKRIIELISNESEYGDDESALFLLWRKLLGRGLVSRELASMEKGNSELPMVEGGGCSSVRAREPR
jgi:hypothetical protein